MRRAAAHYRSSRSCLSPICGAVFFVKSIVDQIGIEPIPEDFQSSVQTTYTTDRQLTS